MQFVIVKTFPLPTPNKVLSGLQHQDKKSAASDNGNFRLKQSLRQIMWASYVDARGTRFYCQRW